MRSVMKLELGLRWRKVRQISLWENSLKNLVLRQQFAVLFIELSLKKQRIINIDETWLGMEDFRRMKWQGPDTPNSVAKKLW